MQQAGGDGVRNNSISLTLWLVQKTGWWRWCMKQLDLTNSNLLEKNTPLHWRTAFLAFFAKIASKESKVSHYHYGKEMYY